MEEIDDFVVAPSERKFPEALERIAGDLGYVKANIVCENVDDDMVAELGEALATNSTLETLSLYLNKVTDFGCIALMDGVMSDQGAGSGLVHLNLGANRISDGGAVALAALLASNGTLKKLILDRNRVTQDGVRALSMALERNNTLDSISLHRNALGDEGARVLGKAIHFNHTLRVLVLDDNGITDKGMEGLASGLRTNLGLQQLHLSSNRIGNGGAHALAAALHKNRSLRVIRLAHNQITDQGVVGPRSIGDMMAQHFMKLEKLFLEGNLISEEAGRRLTKELHRRNRGFRTLHFTVRSEASLEQRKRAQFQRTAPAARGGDPTDGGADYRTIRDKVDDAVDKLKHPSKATRQVAAREFLELLEWSEAERSHDIERLKREQVALQSALEAKDAQVREVDDEKEAVHAAFEAKQRQVQALVEDNEFVSMKLIHQKQEAEQAYKRKADELARLYQEREEAQHQVDGKLAEIAALTHGNEVQLKSPDAGAVGALLHMLQSDVAQGAGSNEQLVLGLTLRGMRLRDFADADKVHESIMAVISDELGVTNDLLMLDVSSAVEKELGAVRSESKSEEKRPEDEDGSDGEASASSTYILFHVVISLEPGALAIFLKNKFEQMLAEHAKRSDKRMQTDAMKFAMKIERFIAGITRAMGLQLEIVSQESVKSDEFAHWPREDLRAQLRAHWPQLVIQFLDEEFADDHESDWAVLRDEWPVEDRLKGDWPAEEAAWALSRLVHGNAECQEEAVAQGAIDILILQLMTGSDWMKAAAASALGSLAVGHELNREKIVDADVILILAALLSVATARMRESVLKALHALVPAPEFKGYTLDSVQYIKGRPIDSNRPIIAGGAVVKFSGDLPAGLVLDERSGIISGTPTKVAANAKYVHATMCACAPVRESFSLLTLACLAPARTPAADAVAQIPDHCHELPRQICL